MTISRELVERISGLFSGSTQFGFWHKIEDLRDEVKEIIKAEKVPITEIPELIRILNKFKVMDYDEYAQYEYGRERQYWTEQAQNPFGSQSISVSDYYDNEVRAEHQGLLEKLGKSPEKKRMIDAERKRRIELIIKILKEIENG